jgi:hypothetical protein
MAMMFLFAGKSSAQQVKTDYDRSTNFTQYKTYWRGQFSQALRSGQHYAQELPGVYPRVDHERTKPKLATRLLTRQERQSAPYQHEVNCMYWWIARSDGKEEIMATAKQMVLIEKLDVEKRSCASRQFANAQRQNIAGQDEEAALVLVAKSGDGHAF